MIIRWLMRRLLRLLTKNICPVCFAADTCGELCDGCREEFGGGNE